MEDGASKLGMLRREGNEKNLKSSEGRLDGLEYNISKPLFSL